MPKTPSDILLGWMRAVPPWAQAPLPSMRALGSPAPKMRMSGRFFDSSRARAPSSQANTAAWEATIRDHAGDRVAADMRIDFVRVARPQTHKVRARIRKAGRRQAVVDVEVSEWDEPTRVVALGRVALTAINV